MTVSSFLAVRLTRLFPAIWLATILSAVYVALRIAFKDSQPIPASLLSAVTLGLALVPYIGAPTTIGGPQIFPLNGPQYSLFLEVVVNVAWFVRRQTIGLKTSVLISVVSFVLLVFTGLGGDTSHDVFSGLPRVFGSFFSGVAVFHLRPRVLSAELRSRTVAFCFLVASTSFFVLSCYPRGLAFPVVLFATIVLCPIIVLSGSLWSPPRGTDGVAKFLGEISYPIYALHYPLFCWLNGVLQSAHWTRGPAELVVCLVGILASSWLLLRFYDAPARLYISSIKGRRKVAVLEIAEAGMDSVRYGSPQDSVTRLKTLT